MSKDPRQHSIAVKITNDTGDNYRGWIVRVKNSAGEVLGAVNGVSVGPIEAADVNLTVPLTHAEGDTASQVNLTNIGSHPIVGTYNAADDVWEIHLTHSSIS